MNFKCDKCSRPATIYLTEIVNGSKIEKHLCEDCAASEGITVKANMSISQLLEDLILKSPGSHETQQLKCDVCGLTFSEFRSQGTLGCPNDYEAFSKALDPLLERAHEGMTQHTGKIPHRAEPSQKKHTAILRLRAQLRSAVSCEDYELAARLRDQIKEFEST